MLAARDDHQLTTLIERARHGDAGVGGAPARLHLGGATVFVKRIPLTDRERRPESVRSTANVFGLPARCHFGVGSPGFGAWRELAATAAASRWVLSRRSERFPLLHHWRVLPGAPTPGDELADIESAVTFWGGSPAVRERLEALAGASKSLVLFLEHIPYTVSQWLDARTGLGESAALAAASTLEAELPAAATFLAGRGVVHFDTHFDNVLTDGHRCYVADFGLATSSTFALSGDEVALVEHARTHDVAYVIARLVNWLVSTFGDSTGLTDPVARSEVVRACAAGADPAGFPAPVAATIRRYAPVAAVVNDFYTELFTVRRDAPYPADTAERELARVSGTGGSARIVGPHDRC